MIFNPIEWDKKIAKPDWYAEAPSIMAALAKLHETDAGACEIEKETIYNFFEDRLAKGLVALGTAGKDFDAERKPIDTVVIHHTSMKPGLSKERLSAIGLLRLYAPQYAAPKYHKDKGIERGAIYSGHFNRGKQVFYAYHWIVRMDGTCERILNDDETGWQAGNWDINCRSVGIVFDNDYEDSVPSDLVLSAAAKLIRERYPQVKKESVIGHCEANKKRTCPSKLFLDHEGREGWKKKLVGMIFGA